MFVNGSYDINFIDNLNYQEIEAKSSKNKDEEYEIAASALASLLKLNQKPKTANRNVINNNHWWEQNYE